MFRKKPKTRKERAPRLQIKRFVSVHCQCGVPWNKLTFSCSNLFSVSGRQSSSDAMRNRIVFIVEGRNRAVCFLDCSSTCRIPYFCLSASCLLLSSPSVKMFRCCISNVLTIPEFFSRPFFFLNPQNNVFSDCMFLAYFPVLTQQPYCSSSRMGQLYLAVIFVSQSAAELGLLHVVPKQLL